VVFVFFFSSRRRHTRSYGDWSSDVCSSDLEEAQDRAGVIVAEQVAAALEGALVTNAVNIPAIRAEDIEALGPFVPLSAKLGRLRSEERRVGKECRAGWGEEVEKSSDVVTTA